MNIVNGMVAVVSLENRHVVWVGQQYIPMSSYQMSKIIHTGNEREDQGNFVDLRVTELTSMGFRFDDKDTFYQWEDLHETVTRKG